MANRKRPRGGPADLVAIFRAFLDERLARDATLDPRLMYGILELAELGLEHPKAQARTKWARERNLVLRVRQLQDRYGVSEAKVRARVGVMSRRAFEDEALKKDLQRKREKAGPI